MTGAGMPLTPLRRPTAEHLHRLQQLRGEGFVTITMDTNHGQRLSVGEIARLERLLVDAETRRAIEPAVRAGGGGDRRIEPAPIVEELRTESMGAGLVLLIGGPVREAYRLGTPPGERVVVDPTFATRDLALDVWSSPEILLLVVAANEARLLLAANGVVSPLDVGGFPFQRSADLSGRGGRRERQRRHGSSHVDRFLGAVGTALRSVHEGRPVVLVAAEPVSSAMRKCSPVRFLGVIPGNRMRATPSELWALTEPMRHRQLDGLRRVELDRCGQMPRDRTAAGVPEVWDAAGSGRVETLLVDPSYRWAAWSGKDGLVRVEDPSVPGAIDDVVDDLIETVAIRGGSVCFVQPGELGSDGVQAVLRR